MNENYTVGHGTPLKEYKCSCCLGKRFKEVEINGQKYRVCKDCLDERDIENLKKIKDL